MEEDLLLNWEKKSADHQKFYKQYLLRADKRKVLKVLPGIHEAAFEKIDCLQCGNCCKSYSPRFKKPDIKRIAKHLKIKEGDFINTYLFMDSEGDYVLKSKPCPFLGVDNFCSIYDERPSDCHRFPYTDEDVFFKRPVITMKNAEFCPIVHDVMHGLLTAP